MHPEAFAFVAAFASDWWNAPPARPRAVVELGARDLGTGSVRALFPGAAYTGVDLVPGPSVDVVADGATWCPPSPPDVVVCCEVLEHTAEAPRLLANAWAMLAPGGRLVVTAAAPGRAPHSAADGGPVRGGEFYRNVAPESLRAWLRGFVVETLQHHPERGDVYAVARKPEAGR